MRLYTIIFALACVAQIQLGFGQDIVIQRSDSIAKIEGEEYIIHVVDSKQTLFSIAKVYEVKLSRIAFDNPGVLDGLKLGQALKILKGAVGETKVDDQMEHPLEVDGNFVLYKVPAKQTLYSIANEHNTTISAILDANPELADGLKVGATIKVPVTKMLGDSKTVKVEMIGLPDIVKTNPAFKPNTNKSTKRHVTLMLPLYLDNNDTLDTHLPVGGLESIYAQSEIALQFYEGFLMALDTLSKQGYSFEVKVIDTENRPWKVRQMVKNGSLKNTDLIIGPFYGKVFAEVAPYAFENCIPIVSPTIKGNSVLNGNSYVFKLIPSEESMIFDLGRYLAQSDSTNNMVLHYGAADEQQMLWKFRQGLESSGMKPASFPAFDIYKSGSDSIRKALSLTKRNNLIILSNNQVRLSGFARKMVGWAEDAYIVGFAPSTWQTFKSVEIDYFDNLRIHMPIPFHVDYSDISIQEFVLKFREKYQGEPTTFAFRGYDLAIHFLRNLNGMEDQGPEYMLSVQETGLQSAFGWKQVNDGGFENVRSRIVDYTGLELKLAKD